MNDVTSLSILRVALLVFSTGTLIGSMLGMRYEWHRHGSIEHSIFYFDSYRLFGFFSGWAWLSVVSSWVLPGEKESQHVALVLCGPWLWVGVFVALVTWLIFRWQEYSGVHRCQQRQQGKI